MPVSTLLPVNVGTYTGQRILRTNLLKSSENERRLWEIEMTREDEQKNMPAIGFGFFSWCVLFGFLGEYCNAFSTYKGYTHAQLCSLRFVCVCVCVCVSVCVWVCVCMCWSMKQTYKRLESWNCRSRRILCVHVEVISGKEKKTQAKAIRIKEERDRERSLHCFARTVQCFYYGAKAYTY